MGEAIDILDGELVWLAVEASEVHQHFSLWRGGGAFLMMESAGFIHGKWASN